MSKNTRNRILLGVSAILLVCLSVGATLAYLTSTTETVTNTFSVGNVKFLGGGLDEAAVNEYGEILYKKTADGKTLTADPDEALKDTTTGEPILADRVTENHYKIIPGHTYVKDPTVHIAAPSEEAYVFFAINYSTLKYVENGDKSVEAKDGDYLPIGQQITTNGWRSLMKPDPEHSNSSLIVKNENNWDVYYYKNKVSAETDNVDLPIFKEFRITTDDVLPKSASIRAIQIVAYVVQADGFATPLDAWNATYGATTNP